MNNRICPKHKKELIFTSTFLCPKCIPQNLKTRILELDRLNSKDSVFRRKVINLLK